jgi:glycerophosphoryl diester phosphodiesterase
MRYLDTTRPRVFGHRGASGLVPENTLPAFAAAIDSGATLLELDVHASRDGGIVVFHDETLERTTDATGPIRERSLAELRNLDAGYGFTTADGSRPFRGGGITIPTLDEVLVAFPETPLNVEIKQREPDIVAAVIGSLERHQATERVLLAAAEDDIMARVRAAAPPTLTGFSMGEAVEFYGRCQSGDFDGYRAPGFALQVPHHHEDVEVVNAAFVDRAHDVGLEVHVWTIDDEAEMHELLDLGVDGLMSDFPARIVGVLRERAAA